MTFDQIEEAIVLATTAVPEPWLWWYYETYKEHVVQRQKYYRLLYYIVEIFKPAFALELGVEYGVASAHMTAAAARYGGVVIGVDRNWHNGPGEEISTMYANYRFVCSDTREAVGAVLDILHEDGSIGVVFQDSSHHYVESMLEWNLYSQMLSDISVWVCDDITREFHDPLVDPPGLGMVQYWESLPGEKRLYDGLHVGNTIGIMLYDKRG